MEMLEEKKRAKRAFNIIESLYMNGFTNNSVELGDENDIEDKKKLIKELIYLIKTQEEKAAVIDCSRNICVDLINRISDKHTEAEQLEIGDYLESVCDFIENHLSVVIFTHDTVEVL